MFIDQLTPHLPKDKRDVKAHIKCLHTMLDAASMVDPALDRDDEPQGHEQHGRRRDQD
jgi:hypothetical protein